MKECSRQLIVLQVPPLRSWMRSIWFVMPEASDVMFPQCSSDSDAFNRLKMYSPLLPPTIRTSSLQAIVLALISFLSWDKCKTSWLVRSCGDHSRTWSLSTIVILMSMRVCCSEYNVNTYMYKKPHSCLAPREGFEVENVQSSIFQKVWYNGSCRNLRLVEQASPPFRDEAITH